MRKSISIFLAILLLNGSTELHQFLRIPLLIAHFKDHRSEEPGMTLSGFLKLHYSANTADKDSDDQQDHQLPFRSMASLQHTDLLFASKKEILLTTPVFPHFSSPCQHPAGETRHRSFAIFHPPRPV